MRDKFLSALSATLLTACSLSVGPGRAAEDTSFTRTVQASEPTTDKAGPRVDSVGAGTPAAVLDNREFESVLGKGIRGSTGENMGRIVDVIVSRTGTVRGAVIDFGGFLGVGSRKIAVEWNALRFNLGDKPMSIALDLTKDQLRIAPEYKAGEPVVMLGAAAPATMPANPPPPQDK